MHRPLSTLTVLLAVASVAVTTAVTTGAVAPASGTTVPQPTAPTVVVPPVTQPGDRPNVVLITTDDQSVDDLRYMPHTRRLIGGEGVTFADAVSAFPLCCPARATLLTGQHAHNHGVLSNSGPGGGVQAFDAVRDRALPVWLSSVGYQTTFTGKYLNGYAKVPVDDVPPGWTSWNAAQRGTYDYYGHIVNRDGELDESTTGIYSTDLAWSDTRRAIEGAVQDDQPFFVWQSNLAPHTHCYANGRRCFWGPPLAAPEDEDRFRNLKLRARDHAAFNERAVADKPDHLQTNQRYTSSDLGFLTRMQRGRIRSLQAVDRTVRATVRLLDRLGELDNTLIIFTSDNGFLLGQHRSFGKILAFEPSLTVPMLMRGPGVPAGRTVKKTVSLVDIPATIADVTGVVPLLVQDGRSLVSVANGGKGYAAIPIEAGSVRSAPVGSYFYQGVRTRRYTYLEYPRTGEAELYDRRKDPHQLDNVAYRPTHRETRRALATMLEDLRWCAASSCLDGGGKVPAPEPAQGPVHPDEMANLGAATQVVTVTAKSWTAAKGTAVAWQKKGRTWRAVRGPFPVQLGGRGMVRPTAYRHLRSKTPAGLYGVASAFGVSDDPGTPLPYTRVDDDDRWPYDPDSRRTYNVFQPTRTAKAAWRAGQEVRWWEDRQSFRHALVLDHNLPLGVHRSPRLRQWVAGRPADVRKGSFIVHTGQRVGRHGWVAVPRARMRWLLQWADPAVEGTLFAVGTRDYLRKRL